MKKLLPLFLAIFAGMNVFASGHVATASGINVSCYGLCNGSASAAASGGIGPYGYSWTGPSGYTASTQNITGLCAGSYVVTAIDSSDMSTAQYTLNITQPAAINVTVNSPTTCSGMTATLTATGATSYSWSAGAISSGPNTASVNPATTTTYTVTGTTSGCSGTAVSTVTVNPMPVITVNSPGICPGQTAFLTATGGMSYSWSPGAISTGASTAQATPPTTTSYTVTGTSSGCTGTAISTVTVNSSPVINVNSYTAHCGMCDGLVVNNTSGAITYSWSGPAGYSSTTASPTGLCPGTYTISATGPAGCNATSTVNILNQAGPVVTISTVTSTCSASNGSATASVSGGTAPYTYMWSPMGATTPVITGLTAGAYMVTITDNMGCVGTATNVVTNIPGPSGFNVSTTDANCGASNGSVTIGAITGGTSPYSYSFNGGTFSSSTFFGALPAGVYNVTVKDANGCVISNNATISNFGGPTAVAITTINSNCSSATGEINIGSVTGGTAPFLYSVNGSAFTSSVNYDSLSAGSYSLLIKDANGCVLSQNVIVLNNAAPVIALDSINGISCSTSIPGNIYISVSGGTPGYLYSWSNGSITEDQTGIFSVGAYVVTVTDMSGCVASQSFFINTISTLYGTVSVVNGNCGTLGTATAVPYGGTAPYTYSWNTVPVQTTSTATNLSSGYFNCIITDALGCSRTVYATVSNGCVNFIKGNVYNDANNNCINDVGEMPLAGKVIIATGATGNHYGYTDAFGNYTIQTPDMNNTVTVSMSGTSYLTPVCPATGALTVNFSTSGDTLYNNNFGY
jgi:hypothetical protein